LQSTRNRFKILQTTADQADQTVVSMDTDWGKGRNKWNQRCKVY